MKIYSIAINITKIEVTMTGIYPVNACVTRSNNTFPVLMVNSDLSLNQTVESICSDLKKRETFLEEYIDISAMECNSIDKEITLVSTCKTSFDKGELVVE